MKVRNVEGGDLCDSQEMGTGREERIKLVFCYTAGSETGEKDLGDLRER